MKSNGRIAIVFASKTRGGQQVVAVLRLMPMTTRGHNSFLFLAFVSQTEKCHVCVVYVQASSGAWLFPRGRDWPVTIGIEDETGLYATPDLDLGRVRFVDRPEKVQPQCLCSSAAAHTQGAYVDPWS